MTAIISYAGDLLLRTLQTVLASLAHNWKILASATVIAVILKTYVKSDKLSTALMKRKKVSIIASVLFGALTPFCACGTSAVILGMLTTALPWGPIMAFLTSSPLMSPDGFVFISGIISLRFAIALAASSIVIGLLTGIITSIIEKKTDFLKNQSRYTDKSQKGCSCKSADPKKAAYACSTLPKTEPCACSALPKTEPCACSTPPQTEPCSCMADTTENEFNKQPEIIPTKQGDQLCCAVTLSKKRFDIPSFIKKYKLREVFDGIVELGLKRMVLFFAIFIAVGYLINNFVPTSIISALFGAREIYAVPLAAFIGLPLYITTESGVPIIQSMMASGASEGAMLAFIIAGSATSAWVIAGLSTFMKKRAIMLYVAYIFIGSVLSGYIYDLILLLI
jgi:uncharacterized membrane protein YraQ (UPF0718 family)